PGKTQPKFTSMDPSPCKYESGSTLGVQLRKSHDDMSLARIKGHTIYQTCTEESFSQYPHQDIQAHGIAQRCSRRLFISIA
ncbi:MAG: hypothetical protein ACKPKO_45300, partial [Candidatus Fonsibacter sp.]